MTKDMESLLRQQTPPCRTKWLHLYWTGLWLDFMYCSQSDEHSVQGQVGWGSEQSGLVEGDPAQGRGLELDDL